MTLQMQDPPHVDEPQDAQKYADILGRVAADGQAVIVRRGGEDLAAVVPLEFLELVKDMLAREHAAAVSRTIDWDRLAKTSPPPRPISTGTSQSRSEDVMSVPVEFGQVVWTEMADANGVRKNRPAIVVTPPERIAQAARLDVVAITTTLPQPLTEEYVLLPWHAQGHPRTGLKRKCAAVCNWVAQIPPSDIQNIAGIVAGPILDEIVLKARAMAPTQSEGQIEDK